MFETEPILLVLFCIASATLGFHAGTRLHSRRWLLAIVLFVIMAILPFIQYMSLARELVVLPLLLFVIGLRLGLSRMR
jgi:hypothetical protein